MDNALRSIKLPSGHTLTVWDDGAPNTHYPVCVNSSSTAKTYLRYTFLAPDASVLFCGADYGVSPMHSIDSDAALLGLLSFLSLRPGDTDSEYFAEYTPEQMAWAQSSECESLSCDLSVAEEAGGCACILWENLDGWECDEDDRGNVADFEVRDHGEDGSQYFPGCGVYGSKFTHVVTGVGDTGSEAFEDALEQMATADPEARMSKLQETWARYSLSHPDKSAFESLDHSDCRLDSSGFDVEEHDWSHWVSIRYNVRGED